MIPRTTPTNLCPNCGEVLAVADINVAEGVALCRACGKLSRLREVVEQPEIDAQALATPPEGCSLEQTADGGYVITASTRSLPSALGLLAFGLFWNGIVSVFLLAVVAGLYRHFIGPLPGWFPAPMEGKESLGSLLFLCVFLTPFVTVGSLIVGACLMSLCGRIEIRLTSETGRIRTGIGPVNWTRRFEVSRVTRVLLGETSYAQNEQHKPLIQIEADHTVKFGTLLSERRRTWLLGMLYVLLVETKRIQQQPTAGQAIRRG